MEGRWPNGVSMVFGNADDPKNEPEVNKWYVDMHIPDVTNPGIFPICTRYENPDAKGGAEQPKFLAIYETDRDDPGAAWTENRSHTAPLRDQGRVSPHMKASLLSVYKKAGAVPASGKNTTGLLVVLADSKDPARDDELIKWYIGTHIPDVIGTGAYHSAAIYESAGVNPDQPKFAAIYETDRPDPMAASGELTKALGPIMKEPGHGTDLLALKMMSGFNFTYSNAAQRAAAT